MLHQVKLIETDSMPEKMRRLFTGSLSNFHPIMEYTVGEIARGLMADELGCNREYLERVLSADHWLIAQGLSEGDRVILYDGKWNEVSGRIQEEQVV